MMTEHDAAQMPEADTIPSIAVLPFNQIGSPDNYFAEGLVDALIVSLASSRELSVISRSSTLAYGGKPIDVPTVGRALGVRYVLTGSARPTAASLRLTIELADGTSGLIIFAGRYEAPTDDLFDAQDRIVSQVLAAILPLIREDKLRRKTEKDSDRLSRASDYLVAQLGSAEGSALMTEAELDARMESLFSRFENDQEATALLNKLAARARKEREVLEEWNRAEEETRETLDTLDRIGAQLTPLEDRVQRLVHLYGL